jgi:hypothetical protein
MTDTQKQELERLIGRIDAHRVSLGLSHSRFATRFVKFVGSQKSWESRLFIRKWDELKPETWLPRLRKFVGEIEGSVGEQEIFASLPIVKHAVYLYETLQTRTNDRRCAMLIGTQGTGKTLALRYLQRDNDFTSAFLSANETWKDSRMRIANALATAVNATVTGSASKTFQNSLDKLKENPMDILIDEAHEGGVLLIKLVKTIINETKCRVLLGIYPTAWRRLLNGANDAYAEAQQLLRRTIRPVKTDWIRGINKEDLSAWCKAVELPLTGSRATDLLPFIRAHGNYSLMADALERAAIVAGETDEEVSPEIFAAQIKELCREPTTQTEPPKAETPSTIH